MPITPKDFGPIYAETDMSGFLVEPWNTVSTLVFLLVPLYWYQQTKTCSEHHRFVRICLPLILIGFIGGAVYHGTRSHNIWLIMDFAPIGICMLLAVSYFFYQLYSCSKISLVFTFLIATFTQIGLRWFIAISELQRSTEISLKYTGLAAILLIPAAVLSLQSNWIGATSLLISAITFAIAITCRQIDRLVNLDYFPMGTHFLWHLFGGISTFFLIRFLYQLGEAKVIENKITGYSMYNQ